MKKFGVVMFFKTDNFGDDIQTYAASRLLPKVDYVIDREHLDSFCSMDGEKVYCIFNGWFLYNNLNWPPSKDIIPLLISMHFTYSLLDYPTSKDLFVERVRNYFNYYGTDFGVGCRDSGTMELLSNNCDNAYLSYCLTLTMDKFDIAPAEEKYICLVDVSDEIRDYVYKNSKYKILEFTHDYRNQTFEEISYEDRMKNVEERLKIYQNAVCVVTNRYHVALPCLSLEVPVALIPSDYEPNRYADLAKILTIYSEDDFLHNNVFDINLPKKNSTAYLDISKKLKKTVNDFVTDYSKNNDDYIEKVKDIDLKKYLSKLEHLERENHNLKRILWSKNDEIYRLTSKLNAGSKK